MPNNLTNLESTAGQLPKEHQRFTVLPQQHKNRTATSNPSCYLANVTCRNNDSSPLLSKETVWTHSMSIKNGFLHGPGIVNVAICHVNHFTNVTARS